MARCNALTECSLSATVSQTQIRRSWKKRSRLQSAHEQLARVSRREPRAATKGLQSFSSSFAARFPDLENSFNRDCEVVGNRHLSAASVQTVEHAVRCLDVQVCAAPDAAKRFNQGAEHPVGCRP